ncbi:MAG: hypothetical protein IPK16_04965 [Anaerolineales bacterium]|nr:hypothetical protein [Anaerolineales bacterium]
MPQPPTPSMVYDIIEASAQPGCPLCRVSDRWGGRFMASILYEEVTDPHSRNRLKASFGFCGEHAWQATEVGGTLLGMSIIYRGLLAQISTALNHSAPAEKKRWWQGRSERTESDAMADAGIAPREPCPACLYLRDMERAALVAVVENLSGNERLRTALSQPQSGFCLPHLRTALAVATDPAAHRFLQETTQARLNELIAEMDEFIRKYDHRFRKEEWGAERDSWQRAIAWVAGGLVDDHSAPVD